ncbi:MAG: hypothetical protein J6Y62_04530 [Clostridia bacterium]|nr:hypothetical protein [Clostridia bacterium]
MKMPSYMQTVCPHRWRTVREDKRRINPSEVVVETVEACQYCGKERKSRSLRREREK